MKKEPDFEDKFGLDPRQRIRGNSRNLPKSIDWDTLLRVGLNKNKGPEKTALGFINNQLREADENNSN